MLMCGGCGVLGGGSGLSCCCFGGPGGGFGGVGGCSGGRADGSGSCGGGSALLRVVFNHTIIGGPRINDGILAWP